MDARKYLDVARRLLTRSAEEDWRTAAGRACYALFLECRDALARWGFLPMKGVSVHHFVRDRFSMPANPDLIPIGVGLNETAFLRTKADYEMTTGLFKSDATARDRVQKAGDALSLLDALEADAARLAAAVAAIRARFP
jgi:hypothetical protein